MIPTKAPAMNEGYQACALKGAAQDKGLGSVRRACSYARTARLGISDCNSREM